MKDTFDPFISPSYNDHYIPPLELVYDTPAAASSAEICEALRVDLWVVVEAWAWAGLRFLSCVAVKPWTESDM